MSWQKIETAPKDGTKVLLYEADQPSEVMLGWWIVHDWWDYADTSLGGRGYAFTHWMPLPPPPSEEDAGE